jgi:hypothetical protein
MFFPVEMPVPRRAAPDLKLHFRKHRAPGART